MEQIEEDGKDDQQDDGQKLLTAVGLAIFCPRLAAPVNLPGHFHSLWQMLPVSGCRNALTFDPGTSL